MVQVWEIGACNGWDDSGFNFLYTRIHIIFYISIVEEYIFRLQDCVSDL